MIYFWK